MWIGRWVTDGSRPLFRQARNLKRYINQLTYAKTQCEKRIKSVGGMGYLTEIDSPESSDSQLIGRKVRRRLANRQEVVHVLCLGRRRCIELIVMFWVGCGGPYLLL